MNMTGYDYLADGKVKDAIEIFRLNAELYPESSNVYDSLGEGLLADKQYQDALENYKRSVEMDPTNTLGAAAIKKIEAILEKQPKS